MRLLILGYGYCAAHFMAQTTLAFSAVTATTRNPAAADDLRSQGVIPLDIAHGFSAAFAECVRQADAILISAPPSQTGDPFVAAVGQALQATEASPAIVYLSTVGVYGDHQGRWIDEATPQQPQSQRGQMRLAAEQAWRDLSQETGASVAILRLPGIYGPGRSAFENLRAGTARRLVKPDQVFNRVHVHDIAGAIGAALELRTSGVWNIVDDEPGPPQDVVTFAADLLGIAPPPLVHFKDADLSPMARSFYGENKRVSNARAKAELGWRLRYPSYREGLRAILETTTKR